MSAVVKLSDKLIEQAKRYASIDNRSIPKQIEHWSRIEPSYLLNLIMTSLRSLVLMNIQTLGKKLCGWVFILVVIKTICYWRKRVLV